MFKYLAIVHGGRKKNKLKSARLCALGVGVIKVVSSEVGDNNNSNYHVAAGEKLSVLLAMIPLSTLQSGRLALSYC